MYFAVLGWASRHLPRGQPAVAGAGNILSRPGAGGRGGCGSIDDLRVPQQQRLGPVVIDAELTRLASEQARAVAQSRRSQSRRSRPQACCRSRVWQSCSRTSARPSTCPGACCQDRTACHPSCGVSFATASLPCHFHQIGRGLIREVRERSSAAAPTDLEVAADATNRRPLCQTPHLLEVAELQRR